MSSGPSLPMRENGPPPPPPTPPKSSVQGSSRQRVRKACEPCRHRKVKCDGGFPCAVCSGYGYDCSFVPAERSTRETDPSHPSPLRKVGTRSHNEVFAGPHAEEGPEAKKRLYVLSEDHQPSKTLKTRFTRVDSVVAFPRSLGISLGLNDPPRLHSFAWNTGTRPERLTTPGSKIFELISLKDMEAYSNIYFTIVHPMFGILDRVDFERRVTRSWAAQEIEAGFEAVLCGVAALGSFFSIDSVLPNEADIAEQGRVSLDLTFAYPSVLISVDLVAGWILRALYLRATTRPHLSWMASNMAMHIAESIGLHQEMSDIKTTQNQPRIVSEVEVDIRRRTFWVAYALNRVFSAQYGRTRIFLQNIGCRYPSSKNEDQTSQFIDLVRLLPLDYSQAPSSIPLPELGECLMKLAKYPVHGPALVLFKAEMAFCIYRKFKYLAATPSPAHIDTILSIIRSSLIAANQLGIELQQWWTIISIPFHSVCILIALDNIESTSLLPDAMETLQNVADICNSHLAREAVRTAQHLAKGAETKKLRELENIQRCLSLKASLNISAPPSQPDSVDMMTDLPSFEWPSDLDLGWSSFLDFNVPGQCLPMMDDMAQPSSSWPA